jgi:uncharacterized protein YjbI with pentapeptide repeats
MDVRFAALGDAVRLNWDDLRRVNLAGVNLKRCELYRVHLEGADLRDAHLEEANLFESDLRGARLRGAHLDGANVRGAVLDPPDDERTGPRYDGKPAQLDFHEWRQAKGIVPDAMENN